MAVNKSQYLKEISSLTLTEEKNRKDNYAFYQFSHFDDWIDKYSGCNHNLSLEPFNTIISDTIKFNDAKKYLVSALCIMPNHVHLIIKPLLKDANTYHPVTEIMHAIKNYSAHKINSVLGINGQFWQTESYDRIIRDENEYLKTIEYVIMNPVKAGLADKWEDWKGTYLCKELR